MNDSRVDVVHNTNIGRIRMAKPCTCVVNKKRYSECCAAFYYHSSYGNVTASLVVFAAYLLIWYRPDYTRSRQYIAFQAFAENRDHE